MAEILRLANIGQTNTYDLLEGNLFAETWRTQPGGPGLMIETFELVAGNVTASQILAAEQTIAEMIDQASAWWKNPREIESIWFEYKTDTEIAKRALVKRMELVPVVDGARTPLLKTPTSKYILVVERFDVFESVAGVTPINIQTVSCMGGTRTISAQAGSAPARINRLYVQEFTGGPPHRVWAGIRKTGPGVGSFVPNWDLNSGTAGTDTSSTADASGLGGNVLQTTFATVATMAQRASITIDQVTGTTDYDHFVGKYLVLLRYKLAAGNVCRVRLKTGFTNSNYFAPKQILKLETGSNYRLIEIGEIAIPPYPFRNQLSAASLLRNFQLQIHAERLSGSGTLYLDSLILVPTDHYVFCDGIPATASTDRVEFQVSESGEEWAVGINGTDEMNANLIYSFRDWECPIEGGLFVLAFERDGSSVLTDEARVNLEIFRRHRVHAE